MTVSKLRDARYGDIRERKANNNKKQAQISKYETVFATGQSVRPEGRTRTDYES